MLAINAIHRHRNPLVRRTTAQYIYKCCELLGPGKILSGIKDVTEKVLTTASQFVVDGPADIRSVIRLRAFECVNLSR